MANTQKLLELRKQMKAKKPHFKRQDWHKKARLKPVWRRPKGMDSKLRRHMHGHGEMPNSGYRGPALVRGMHKSGLVPMLVHTLNELNALNPKTHGAIIGATVGIRRRVELATAAKAKSLRVLNIKDTAKFVQSVKDDLAQRKQAKNVITPKPEVKAEKKPEPKKEPHASQEEKKEQEKKDAEKVLTSK
jgi:large subunit ribosomal protein L32e